MLRKIIFFLLVGSSIASLRAQVSNYQVTMIKGMIQQFNEMEAGSVESMDYSEEVAPFVPIYEALDKSIYEKAMSDVSSLFSLTDVNGGYLEIDGKEYPTNNATLVFNYLPLPGFQNINAWFELSAVKDSDGKNLLLDSRKMDKYREMGIIEEGFNYPMPGEYSESIWFNREMKWEETINIEGSIHMEIPGEFQSAVFTSSDLSGSKTVDGLVFTLVAIDDNIGTYRVKGDRRKLEGISPVFLDKEDKPYLSNESVTIDANMFDFDRGKVKELSDEEIEASVSDFDYSNFMIDQVKKTRVGGKIDKIVLLKINTTEPVEYKFSISPVLSF